MNRNKFIQLIRSFMARKKNSTATKVVADELRVQLIPYFDSEEDVQLRKESVRKIIGLMFTNLSKRGRPKKMTKGNKDVA